MSSKADNPSTTTFWRAFFAFMCIYSQVIDILMIRSITAYVTQSI